MLFGKLYAVGRCLLERELDLVKEVYQIEGGDGFNGMVEWIRESRRVALTVLEEMARLAYQEPRSEVAQLLNRPQRQRPRDEIFQENVTRALMDNTLKVSLRGDTWEVFLRSSKVANMSPEIRRTHGPQSPRASHH